MTAEHRHEEHELLVETWRIVRDRGYLILAVFALSVAVAAGAVRFMTPIYRATAQVRVYEDITRMVGIPGAYPIDITERYYRTQGELLKGREVLTAVAKRLRLTEWEEYAGVGEKGIASALGARVTVTPVPQSQLLDVSYEGPNSRNVARVANEIVKCFEELSIRRRQSSSESAATWLDERLPRLREKVEDVQSRLQAFQEEHKIISLDREHDTIQRLSQLNRDVTVAEKARIEIEGDYALVAAARDEPGGLDSLPVVADNQIVRALELQIIALQSQRTDKLRTVGPGHRDVKAIDEKIADLRKERREKALTAVATLAKRLEAARWKERNLRSLLAEQEKKALLFSEKLIKLTGLQRELEYRKQLLEPLLARSGQLKLASGLDTIPVQVTSWAVEPQGPVKPRRTLIVGIGGILGLIAGANLAFLLERLHSKIRSAEELERVSGLRALGAVPHMTSKDDAKRFLACHFDPKSTAAEAFRSIRTQLLVPDDGAVPRVLMVTSPLDEEGKTTTATNIASALAQTDKRVLLVDADMRRSWAHRPFKMDKSRGLSVCLADGLAPGEAVQVSEVPNLSVLPAGAAPPNPAELLGSSRMREFVEWAKAAFDFVVFDAPPVAVVTDPSVIAPFVDGVLLVVRTGRTPRRAARHGRQLVEGAQGRVIGAVLNDAPRRPWYYGDYGYGYGYGYYHRYRHYAREPDAADEPT